MAAVWVFVAWPLFTAQAVAANAAHQESNHAAVRFVRQGIVVEGTKHIEVFEADDSSDDGADESGMPSIERRIDVESMTLDGSRTLTLFNWRPEARYRINADGHAQTVRAPLAPEPFLLRKLELEDATLAASAGSAPDTVLKFSPDGERLAIGTFGGWLRILEVRTGRLLYRLRIAEGMVKELAWSPDGRQLYVGEQSPDALLFAVATPPADRAGDGYRQLWSVRFADLLETSLPQAGDRFGVYTLPAVHDLAVADDGRVMAAGVHSWPRDGHLRQRSLVMCLAPDGTREWQFPPEGTLGLVVRHIAIDDAGSMLLFLPSHGPKAPEGSIVEPNTLYQLDARTGQIAARHRIDPLEPHFTKVEAWDSVAMSRDGTRATVGLADGRAMLFESGENELRRLRRFDLGAPLLIGGVPISAACSYARFWNGGLALQTQNTHISFGSSQTAHQPPTAHHGANTFTWCDLEGNPVWRYRGPFSLRGQWADRPPQGRHARWLVMACGDVPGATEPGQFGCLVFDTARPGGGREKLLFHYPTAGPVLFDADMSRDGHWIAVTEVPAQAANGQDLYGTYQVHILH